MGKKCNFCGKNENDGSKFDFKKTKCNECVYKYQREYMRKHEHARKKKYQREKDRIKNMSEEDKMRKKNINKIWRKTLKQRFNRCKKLAISRNIDFQLNIEEFSKFANSACIYCKNILCPISEIGSNIDRINNSLGYTINNVVSCCKVCNGIKSDILSMEETIEVISLILKMRDHAAMLP